MCKQYQDNRYPILWIPHLIMVISLLIGCIKLRYAICKKFIGFILMIYHSFWLVGDIMCYTPVMSNSIALFSSMYVSLLITTGLFDGLLVYCKCWGKEEEEPILHKFLSEIEEEDEQKTEDP